METSNDPLQRGPHGAAAASANIFANIALDSDVSAGGASAGRATDVDAAECRGAGVALGESVALSAALELLVRLADCHDLSDAANTITGPLKTFFSARRVVIAWQPNAHAHCQVIGDTQSPSIPSTARRVSDDVDRKLIAALDELTILGRTVCVPDESAPQGRVSTAGTLAVTHFANSLTNGQCVGGPLFDAKQSVCGAWLIVEPVASIGSLPAVQLVDMMSRPIGSGLASVYSKQPSPLQQRVHRLGALVHRIGSMWMIAIGLLLLAATVLPIRYHVRCSCTLEPVNRRYVVAPMAGSLDKSLVRPGDFVHQDQVVARMNARELNWELSGLRADLSRAQAERKVAFAKQDFAAAQIAELEAQQLQHRTELLESRLESLEVRSPIKGVIVSGDAHEVEGAPLERGQTLFEVAPVGSMRAQLAIDQRDYAYVRPGMEVDIDLDSITAESIHGTVLRVHPAAEVLDNRNVFIAEVNVDDPQGIYRSGMRGRAAVASDLRPLVWVILHRPWAAFRKWLPW